MVLDISCKPVLGSIERMAIHQTKRQTDLEKRLTILRRQVYGRESVASSKQYVTTNYPLPASQRGEPTTDITYLQGDLIKISIFAGSALGLQIILYFLIKNNILNINLF